VPENYSESDRAAAIAMTASLRRQILEADRYLLGSPGLALSFIRLERSEIYTADVEVRLERFAYQYALARSILPGMPCIRRDHQLIPVDLHQSYRTISGRGRRGRPRFVEEFYFEDMYDQLGESVGSGQTEVVRADPDAAFESMLSLLTEFLAVRFSARQSDISDRPGLPFEVSTESNDLRIYYSPCYFHDLETPFASPSTPIRQWIQPGRYFFGAMGRNVPLQFEFKSHYSIPYDDKAHLYI
jgi:hypothetical protein